MPPDLKDRVASAATANNRSMNAEIVATLEEKYPAPLSIEEIVASIRDGIEQYEKILSLMPTTSVGEHNISLREFKNLSDRFADLLRKEEAELLEHRERLRKKSTKPLRRPI